MRMARAHSPPDGFQPTRKVASQSSSPWRDCTRATGANYWRGQGEDPIGHAHLALTEPPELRDVLVRDPCHRQCVANPLTEAARRRHLASASTGSA